jgi:phosphate transport system substrate-binding protein
VFITHKDNPVNSLTAEQIRGIYSGKITNWKEVGGSDCPITPFQRDENSGSQTTMEKQVMQGMAMLKPEAAQVPGDMGDLVDSVAEYRNGAGSIGYTFKYYIETLYKNENIKMLRVDGVAPDDTAIQSEAYPFWVYYYGVIRAGDEKKTGGLFLDWVLSNEGQRCVRQAGYCPL